MRIFFVSSKRENSKREEAILKLLDRRAAR
jgi:hypothetical protein